MSRNTILTIVCAVIVAGGLGYYFLFFTGNTDPALTQSTAIASDAEISFISLVSKLDPITFDTRLLSDPRFTARQDIRTTIVPEAAGRKDPFAPLGK